MPRKAKKSSGRSTMRVPRPNVPVVDLNHPENYITIGMNGVSVGSSTGAVGTGSLAFNDQLMNTSTGTGVPIQLGTGTNLRVGKHIFFTRLLVRLRVTFPNQSSDNNNILRIIVAKNPRDSTIANLSTNTALTGAVEGPDYLEAPQQYPVGFSSPSVCDYFQSPSSDYTFLHDCMYPRTMDTAVLVQSGSGECTNIFNVELDIPLRLSRSYDSSNAVDTGSWYIHFIGQDLTSGSSPSFIFGQMRLQYVNQFNFESIGRGIKSAVSTFDDVVQHVGKSAAWPLLLKYAPMVFGA